MPRDEEIAVVLSGGGARGAYQAGVLKGIAEILDSNTCPFRIISGVSAGAINGTSLAAGAKNFRFATELLWSLWSDIETDQVYVTEAGPMFARFLQWFESLAGGGRLLGRPPSFIFDTTPLLQLLRQKVDFAALAANVKEGVLSAASVSATNYQCDQAVSFFAAGARTKPWSGTSHRGLAEPLKAEHVLASAALPIFFRPQRIGKCDFGDGGIALKAPLSPAIKLGASSLCVIGIHNPTHEQRSARASYRRVTVGDISGTLLNSMLFGAINDDLLNCQAVNAALRKTPAIKRDYRILPILNIQPSRDLGQLESNDFAHFPFMVRHLLRGFGISQHKSWDLLSYLAFHPTYARELLKLGRADAFAQRREIRKFFRRGGGTT